MKIDCLRVTFPSKWGVFTVVTKNWDPLVPGPALAIDNSPDELSCLISNMSTADGERWYTYLACCVSWWSSRRRIWHRRLILHLFHRQWWNHHPKWKHAGLISAMVRFLAQNMRLYEKVHPVCSAVGWKVILPEAWSRGSLCGIHSPCSEVVSYWRRRRLSLLWFIYAVCKARLLAIVLRRKYKMFFAQIWSIEDRFTAYRCIDIWSSRLSLGRRLSEC